MAIIVKQEKNYVDPPEGIHLAICVDVTEPQEYETAFGPKLKIRLVWELDEKMPEGSKGAGKPYLASKFLTPSLNERATLFKLLQSWRGKPFTQDELKGFDIEKLIGVSCQLVIEPYVDGKGVSRTKVANVVKAKEKLEPSGEYVRMKDRPKDDFKGGKPETQSEQIPLEDDDIPF